MYQIVTSNKVFTSPIIESTQTLFVLRLMQTQFSSKDKDFKIEDKKG